MRLDSERVSDFEGSGSDAHIAAGLLSIRNGDQNGDWKSEALMPAEEFYQNVLGSITLTVKVLYTHQIAANPRAGHGYVTVCHLIVVPAGELLGRRQPCDSMVVVPWQPDNF